MWDFASVHSIITLTITRLTSFALSLACTSSGKVFIVINSYTGGDGQCDSLQTRKSTATSGKTLAKSNSSDGKEEEGPHTTKLDSIVDSTNGDEGQMKTKANNINETVSMAPEQVGDTPQPIDRGTTDGRVEKLNINKGHDGHGVTDRDLTCVNKINYGGGKSGRKWKSLARETEKNHEISLSTTSKRKGEIYEDMEVDHMSLEKKLKDDAQTICRIPLVPDSGPDRWICKHTKDGVFIVKTTYKMLVAIRHAMGAHNSPSNLIWKRIWKLKMPPKLGHFIWRRCLNIISTTEASISQGMKIPNSCCYHKEEESIFHALFRCMQIQEVWDCNELRHLIPNESEANFHTWSERTSSTNDERRLGTLI
ncbi:hypothetical protein L6164_008670 [Bauhinia variegata]|uniref:Uncharacterized protein n=1 Tax=Bauhinia variegata TaxID=167791 RepID=A0ACB9PGB4_BAUVA|nr:hypothetical protein L6164_008670 [Bauhinia variegata]